MPSAIDLLNKITKKKRSQADVLKYLSSRDRKLHDRLKSCASYLLLRDYYELGETKVRNANFCKRFQICPACAVRRGARLAQAGLEKVQLVMAENRDLRPLMVTLTVPNTKNLCDGLEGLKSGFTAMMTARRKSLHNPVKNLPIEFCKVQGGIKSIEATHKGKGWHPHMHMFVLADDWIDRIALSKECVRFGLGKIVDVRLVKPKELDPQELTDDEAETLTAAELEERALISGLLETLKYPTKFSELSPAKRYEFYLGTKKTRLTDCFGNLRGVKIGDIDQDDLYADESYIDWVARWYHHKQGFRLWKANAWDDADEAAEEVVPEVD